MKQIFGKSFAAYVLIALLLIMPQCASKTATAQLPKDIFGISVGMNKDDAEARLREIADFKREERKRQQVWYLKDDPSFGYLAFGWDENSQVRYVTAIAKPKGGKLIPYTDIGDISKAKQEITGPNHRYTWEIPAQDGKPAYLLIVHGKTPEHLSMYTLSKMFDAEEEEK